MRVRVTIREIEQNKRIVRGLELARIVLDFFIFYFSPKQAPAPMIVAPTRLQCQACKGEEVIRSPFGGVWRECFLCGGKGYVAASPNQDPASAFDVERRLFSVKQAKPPLRSGEPLKKARSGRAPEHSPPLSP